MGNKYNNTYIKYSNFLYYILYFINIHFKDIYYFIYIFEKNDNSSNIFLVNVFFLFINLYNLGVFHNIKRLIL